MVDYIYRCGLSVLSFGKSVQSYKNFLTYANKTQKIAVICVFLIISPIFMSSFVHYLCPPSSIIYVLLRPLVGQFYCPLSIRLSVYLLLRLSFGISFFLHPPCMADRKCRLLYCLFVFSLFKGKGWGVFSSFVPAESWLLFSLFINLPFIHLPFIFLVIHFPCNHCYIIALLLGGYWVIIGLLLGNYWVIRLTSV